MSSKYKRIFNYKTQNNRKNDFKENFYQRKKSLENNYFKIIHTKRSFNFNEEKTQYIRKGSEVNFGRKNIPIINPKSTTTMEEGSETFKNFKIIFKGQIIYQEKNNPSLFPLSIEKIPIPSFTFK